MRTVCRENDTMIVADFRICFQDIDEYEGFCVGMDADAIDYEQIDYFEVDPGE